MEKLNAFSRRCLFWVLFVNLVFLCFIDGGIYYAAGYVFKDVSFAEIMGVLSRSATAEDWVNEMLPFFAFIKAFFIPATAGIFILMTMIQWLILRGSFKRVTHELDSGRVADKAEKEKDAPKSAKADTDDRISRKTAQEQNKRYYLHLLSVLQREGRLVDFFKEDLSAYEDAQIGAAVRSIHENCAKTVEKYLAPKGVMDKPEGETVTIPEGFDPTAIKLTGNVTGSPPFKGVLRHRGWKAAKLELPVLSGSGESQIIAPAEVEIS